MSFYLQGPMPQLSTTIKLPNPQLGDTKSPQNEVDVFRAINGTRRTSVKKSDRILLTFDFRITRIKAEELKEFIRLYHSEQLRIKDHNDDYWEVYLTNNPFEFAQAKTNTVVIQLQFQGNKVS